MTELEAHGSPSPPVPRPDDSLAIGTQPFSSQFSHFLSQLHPASFAGVATPVPLANADRPSSAALSQIPAARENPLLRGDTLHLPATEETEAGIRRNALELARGLLNDFARLESTSPRWRGVHRIAHVKRGIGLILAPLQHRWEWTKARFTRWLPLFHAIDLLIQTWSANYAPPNSADESLDPSLSV